MKSFFPATYSTLDENALAEMISKAYQFHDVNCRFIVRGVGDTYLVHTAGERYILRIYRPTHRDLAHVQAETHLLTALRHAGVAVSYPVADSAGNVIQYLPAVEGERLAVLFTYAEGESLNQFNKPQLMDLGKEMAGFHNISASIQLPGKRWTYDPDTLLFQPIKTLQPYFAHDPGNYAWLHDAAGKIQHSLNKLATATFATGYCHFDFLPKNYHFNGDKVTFFDFDFLGYGWLLLDIMTFYQHLALDVFFKRISKEQAKETYSTFLSSYQEHRKLNADELAAIPLLSLGFWLFYSGFHTTHDQFYTLLQPAVLKQRMGLIKLVIEIDFSK